jgi:NTP pyrophosphatase (non-canonical NTP hydrolase)
MGKFKDVGDPSLALAEECAEVIQVITKLHRFNGNWNEVPDGKEQTRWEELQAEFDDVIYQYNRLVKQIVEMNTDK